MRRGDRVELEIGPVAHGGHCVARTDGRVIFVRHTLPGERVIAEITDVGAGSRFLRADAVEVLAPSPDRVEPPCPYAGPGRCGGCDWQHVDPAAQRQLKASVVAEQLRRLPKIDWPVEVEALPGHEDGLGWRTRVQYAVDEAGRVGFRKHRSHEIMPVDRCLIAHDGVDAAGVSRARWPGRSDIEVVVGFDRSPVVLMDGTLHGGPTQRRAAVVEHAAGRPWRVAATGFWQVHPAAADSLVDAVRRFLQARPGERALDLYSGVGLFAGALAGDLGPAGTVTAVESEPRAVADARRNVHDLPQVRLVQAPVEAWLAQHELTTVDLVVLDPPRSGAKRTVVEKLAALRPRAIAYVACDPAALARDLGTFRELGYELAGLRAFDLFPMTGHVECVAHLVPAVSSE